jgi:C-terminal processing protease CtpA/Prc
MKLQRVMIAAALCGGIGCAPRNWFQSHFVDARTTVGAHPRPTEPATGDPQFANGGRVLDDEKKLLEDGYVRIGTSEFTCQDCAEGYENAAKKAAKAVGAAYVIVYQHDAGVSTEYRKELVGTGQYDYDWEEETSQRAVDDGQGGTRYETETTYQPHVHEKMEEQTNAIQHDKIAYFATFWAKAKPDPLGVYTRRLTKAEHGALQRMHLTAVAVWIVVRGSPAANGGIAAGDFLTSFGDTPIAKATPLRDQISKNAGQHVTIHGLHANGSPFTAEVTLGAVPIADPPKKTE